MRDQVMAGRARELPAGVPEPRRRDHPVPPAEARADGRDRRHPARAAAEAARATARSRSSSTTARQEWLAEKGYDPAYGARPLKRVIQKQVQDPLAEKILAGEVRDGDPVEITAGKDRLMFNGEAAKKAA